MRAPEHAASRVPSGAAARVRRSGVVALATFAALLTLVLPSPAFARPASTGGGAVATTGSSATSGGLAGRRAQRVDQARSSRPVTGRTASAPAGGVSVEVGLRVHVAGVSHVGPVLSAALPDDVRTALPSQAVLHAPHEPGPASAAPQGARSSRAPPTA